MNCDKNSDRLRSGGLVFGPNFVEHEILSLKKVKLLQEIHKRLGVVHKLCGQGEVGRWSKMLLFVHV
jgi:hypothetical protein